MMAEQAPAPEDLPQVLAPGRSRFAPPAPMQPPAAPVPAPPMTEDADVAMANARQTGANADRAAAAAELLAKQSAQQSPHNQLTFEALLVKQPGMMLGVEVFPLKVGNISGLWVEVVAPGGAVDAWNQSNPPAFNIRPGDCIVGINNVASVSQAIVMMEELRTRQEFRVTVRRTAGNTRPTAVIGGEGGHACGAGNLIDPAAMPLGAPAAANMPLPQTAMGAGMVGSMGPGDRTALPTSAVTPEVCGGAPGLELGPEIINDPLDDDSLALAPPSMNTGAASPPSPRQQKPVFSFHVDVECPPGMRLGLEVMLMSPDDCGMVIKRIIEGGFMSQWNQQRRQLFRVQPGDYITQVNGIGCWDWGRMADEFSKEHQPLSFTVQRGCRGDSAGAAGHMAGPSPCQSNGPLPNSAQMPPQPQPQPLSPQDAPPGLPIPVALTRPQAPPQPPVPQQAPLARQESSLKAPPPPPPVTLGHQGGGACPERGWNSTPGHVPPQQQQQNFAVQGQNQRRPEVPDSSLHPMVAARGIPAPVEEEPAQEPPIRGEGPEAQEDYDTSYGRHLTQLFQSTLQLNDEEASQLLRESLHRRPWLRAPVAQALGVL